MAKSDRFKEKPPTPLERFFGAIGSVFTGTAAVIKSLKTPDANTRWSSLLFTVCVIAALTSLVIGIQTHRARNKTHSKEEDTLGLLDDKAEKPADWITLVVGEFKVDLEPIGTAKPLHSKVNRAEMTLTIQCDKEETCEYAKKNLDQVRDQIVTALTRIDRQELLTTDGKKRFKDRILQVLNAWLNEGQITDIFITRLVVG